MAINFSEFGFFDGVTKVDQINWPKYLDSYVTDGVVKGYGNDLQVYGNSSGMKVLIKTGKVFVHTHFGILSNEIELGIPVADPAYGRKDLVVARAVYASAPNSVLVLDVKTGVPSSNPVPPTLTKTAGVTWEVPLAIVSVAAGASTIAAGNVTDARIYSVIPLERGGVGSTTQAEALSNIFGGSQLSITNGGTGASTAANARANLGLGSVATENTVPVTKGGTGATAASTARTNLGLGSVATENTVPVAKGGTGATAASTARTNLGLGSVATENTVPVAKGGTGATDASTARSNLGVNRSNLGFGGAAILQTVTKQVTLSKGSWSSGVITISDSDVQANSIILLDPTESSRSAFFASDIRKNSQGSGSYSLRCTTTPTANLVCDVVIMKVG